MRALIETVLILVLTLVAAVGTHHWHPRAPALYLVEEPLLEDEVTMQDIAERWNNEVLWIDARPRNDYEKGHVPHALLLNEQEADDLLYDHFNLLQDNTKPIIIYCDGEACQASRKMKQYLAERIPAAELYVLKGGWKSWQQTQR